MKENFIQDIFNVYAAGNLRALHVNIVRIPMIYGKIMLNMIQANVLGHNNATLDL